MTLAPLLRLLGFPVLLLLTLIAPLNAAERQPVYTVAVVPQFTATEIHRDWVPFLERLARDTGFHFELQVAQSIPTFEAAVLAGGPDFAFMNPYHQIMARQVQGYLPLVRDDRPLTGILVVRQDDPIKSVKELDGKEIAFPAPNSLGASLWLRAILAEQEKIKFTPLYVKTHTNAYRHVLLGRAAAGGGVNNTFSQEPAEVRANLRILLETPGVPSHPLSAHPRVAASVRLAVSEAILKMAKDPGGRALLSQVQMPNPVSADYARDYRPLEKYRLERYVVREKQP